MTDMYYRWWVNPNGYHYSPGIIVANLNLRHLNTSIKYSVHVIRIIFDV